jgi:hypothetical protein
MSVSAKSLLVFLLAAAALCRAQVSIDPTRFPLNGVFDHDPVEHQFGCRIQPARTMLTFAFQFQSGWTVEIPFKNIRREKHRIVILARIVPERIGKPPLYLYASGDIPERPERAGKTDLVIDGGFLLGPGRYTVEVVVMDDVDSFCRNSWTLETRLSKADSEIAPVMQSGDLFALESGVWARFVQAGGERQRSGRITVLLNAAPFSRRSVSVGGQQSGLLLSSLAALLRFTDFATVRLVAYNLDQQKVIYSEDNFSAGSINDLARAMRELNLGTVPIQVLNRPAGHIELLSDLLEKERRRPDPSDTVLFFGPTVPFDQKWKVPAALETHLLDFDFRPFWGLRQPEFPDLIEHLTKAHGGRVFRIHSPREFAKALRELSPAR